MWSAGAAAAVLMFARPPCNGLVCWLLSGAVANVLERSHGVSGVAIAKRGITKDQLTGTGIALLPDSTYYRMGTIWP